MESYSNRILIIDDNKDIHEDYRKVLIPSDEHLNKLKEAVFEERELSVEAPTYEIDSAFQGEEGLQQVQKSLEEQRPYFLAFVDIRMPPGWDGVETIEKILAADRDIQTVICTAYSDYTWPDMIRKLGWSDRVLILKKPFDSIEVHQLACALKEKWQLLQQSRFRLDFLQAKVDERTAEIRATLEATTDGILVISKQAEIIDYNLNFQKLWKDLTWKNEGIESILKRKNLSELISFIASNIVDGDLVKSTFESLIYNFDEMSYGELRLEIFLKNGKTVELYTRPLQLKREMSGRVLNFRDVTEERYFEEQLTFQATHDPLTHLPNRMLLVDRLQQAIFQAQRDKTQIAVIFLDLDRFKIINDSLGHNFGDILLTRVADRLQTCKQASDTLCRVGGDEFVFILPEVEDKNLSFFTIQRIQEALRKPFMINNHQLSLTPSLGISYFPKNGATADELLKNADAAMYRAKAMGKNTFQYYTADMNAHVRELLDMEQNLILAYKLGELLLYYQPILDVQTKRISGTEALLRWNHPQLGMIAPEKFISIAEETGLIIPIGEWVLRRACEQNLQWQKKGFPPTPIAVNLSGYQVKNSDTIKMIEKVLDEIGYEGKYLELELTENVLMESTIEIKEIFKRLRGKGVSFVIDDFGTGYSNLNYLIHYPITKIKIDKSFILNIEKDPLGTPIIRAIISMAHSLNMKVVAEGVETELQYRFLLENQCDEMQGFYFSQPIDADAYTLLLKNGMHPSVENSF